MITLVVMLATKGKLSENLDILLFTGVLDVVYLLPALYDYYVL